MIPYPTLTPCGEDLMKGRGRGWIIGDRGGTFKPDEAIRLSSAESTMTIGWGCDCGRLKAHAFTGADCVGSKAPVGGPLIVLLEVDQTRGRMEQTFCDGVRRRPPGSERERR